MCERGDNEKMTSKSLVLQDTITQITVDDKKTPVIDYLPRRLAFQHLDKPYRTAVEYKSIPRDQTLGALDQAVPAIVGNPVVYRLDKKDATGAVILPDERIEVRSRGTAKYGGQPVTYEISTILRRKL